VLTSLKTHWGGLTVFVTHPQVPMDNNSGERGVRKGVLGVMPTTARAANGART